MKILILLTMLALGCEVTAQSKKPKAVGEIWKEAEAQAHKKYCSPRLEYNVYSECDGEKYLKTQVWFNGELVFGMFAYENWNAANSMDVRRLPPKKLPYCFTSEGQKRYMVMYLTDSIKQRHKFIADSVLTHFKENVKLECQ